MLDKLGAQEEQYNEEQQNLDKMPFGKYEGKNISDLNPYYIKSLLSNCDWITDPLKSKLEASFDKSKEEKECFGYMENPEDKKCLKCPFYKDCKEKTQMDTYTYDDIDVENIENW
jgi:hypothetical protein